MNKAQSSESAFRFEGFYFERQSQRLAPPGKAPRGDRLPALSWDWRRLSESVLEVKIGVRISPTSEVPEELEVVLVGRFSRAAGPDDESAVASFAATNAVAILLPYAREALSALSGRGPFGTFVLQPINVVELAKTFDQTRPTGAHKIRPAKQRSVRRRIGKPVAR